MAVCACRLSTYRRELRKKALAPARNKPSYDAKGDELNPVWQKQKSDD